VAGSGLGADFYARPVLDVARDLLGCVVTHGECSGLIVETEAYHDSEPAAHSFIGVTRRTVTLFGPPGRSYVYRSYGIHACLNAVCEPEGVGAAVLIRALEPRDGIPEMVARRGTRPGDLRALCSGPGKLTQALGIELVDNDCDLAAGPVTIAARPDGWTSGEVVTTPRIGITKAALLPWRFVLAGSPYVSVKLPGVRRGPRPR
jgi:DNA-3-methyladenine glycosylase